MVHYNKLLRELRKTIADEENLPPYVIFHDAVLTEMSLVKPTTKAELLDIKGIGNAKAEKYGKRFIEIIEQYGGEKGDIKEKIEKKVYKKADVKDNGEVYTHIASWNMLDTGMSISQIAEERGIKEVTVQSHIVKAATDGKRVEWSQFFTESEEKLIKKVLDENEGKTLTEVKMALPDEIDFFKIRAVMMSKR